MTEIKNENIMTEIKNENKTLNKLAKSIGAFTKSHTAVNTVTSENSIHISHNGSTSKNGKIKGVIALERILKEDPSTKPYVDDSEKYNLIIKLPKNPDLREELIERIHDHVTKPKDIKPRDTAEKTAEKSISQSVATAI